MQTADLFRKKTVAQVLEQAAAGDGDAHAHGLAKTLRARDLVSLGIAAIVGAGIFSTIGLASAAGGPAVILLFIFTAIACTCTAFAYAEFASLIPVAGSAYTYSYVAFGELVAWILGWALVMEYAVGNVTVAVSWSDYFCALLDAMRIHVPAWASTDYVSASRGFGQASAALAQGGSLAELDAASRGAYDAWTGAPQLGGWRLILDIPAILITLIVTRLVYVGMKETRDANNVMVAIKLAVMFLVIVVGVFFVQPSHWSPFAPNGVAGVLQGISAVFFAYIGFDAISTTAEECKDPQRDLPRGIMWAILISTVLYVLIALVLTGIVSYDELGVGDPLAYVFMRIGMPWFSAVIAVSAVVAMASVLLVYQLGQPRIWLAMSRDGLLPKKLATVHPRHHTPSFATLVTAAVVIVTTLLIPSHEVLNLCSMGTLLAFVLVCAGVLRLRGSAQRPPGSFRTPYVNGRYWLPLGLIALAIFTGLYFPERLRELIEFRSWSTLIDLIPRYVFIAGSAVLAVRTFRNNLSLIPALGLLFSLFMMAQIPVSSWLGFAVWLAIGLAVYFSFGISHSRLASRVVTGPAARTSH